MKRFPLVVAGLLIPQVALTQLPDPSTRALGMGDAYTSLARGYEAVFWNPSMLAALGRPGLSIGLPHGDLDLGSNSYGSSDFRTYARKYLTNADKQTLLDKITSSDSTLTIRTAFGVAPFGLSIGPVGLAVGVAGEADLALGKDLVDLALFGNVRRLAPGQVYTDRASIGHSWGATTAAASLALPFSLPVGHLSVGVTGKYVIANMLAAGSDIGLSLGANPVFQGQAQTQALYSDTSAACKLGHMDGCIHLTKVGTGFGVDLGGTLQLARGGITLSAVLVNAVGKMSWDLERFAYERTNRAIVQNLSGTLQDTVLSKVTLKGASAIAGDPQARALRDSLLAHANFARLARLGVALNSGALTLAGSMQFRLAKGLDQQSSQVVSGGAEYRLLGVVPLRAGASWDFQGATMLSAGIGLQFLGINIDAAIADVSGTVNPGTRVGLGVGLIW